jgi:hypothetical protein
MKPMLPSRLPEWMSPPTIEEEPETLTECPCCSGQRLLVHRQGDRTSTQDCPLCGPRGGLGLIPRSIAAGWIATQPPDFNR